MEAVKENYFSYFSTKTYRYVMGTQKNSNNKMFFWATKTFVKTDG